MYEDNVSIFTATKAKELGFQYITDEAFNTKFASTAAFSYWRRNNVPMEDLVMLPTCEVLAGWLRYQGVDIWIEKFRDIDQKTYYRPVIFEGPRFNKNFTNYFEAYDSGLHAALGLLEQLRNKKVTTS